MAWCNCASLCNPRQTTSCGRKMWSRSSFLHTLHTVQSLALAGCWKPWYAVCSSQKITECRHGERVTWWLDHSGTELSLRDFTDAAGKYFLCVICSDSEYHTCNFDWNLVLFSQSLPIRHANLMSIEMSSQLRCDSLQILHNYPGQLLRVPGYHWPKVINRGLTHHCSCSRTGLHPGD